MKNTFGESVSVTLFGESHGNAIGAILDGMAPGIPVDTDFIAQQMGLRRSVSSLSTARKETDEVEILSGVKDGVTTGTPIAFMIRNQDMHSKDYESLKNVARPGHADYTAYCKYHGFSDTRGGGHFSGRITAALVACGGILLPALKALGITVGTHVLSCGGAQDRAFEDYEKDIAFLQSRPFPVLDADVESAMTQAILSARQQNDSVGGITQTAIAGLPAGLGEPWFDSVESMLAHAVFSLGGIKGIEFGSGFSLAGMMGSQSNDAFRIRDGGVVTETNHNGGINGGITNGMPVVFQCAVKPTPSIAKEQKTVNFQSGTDEMLTIHGRHDPAIVRRICPVLDSVAALVICDLLVSRFGTDVLLKGIPSCNTD